MAHTSVVGTSSSDLILFFGTEDVIESGCCERFKLKLDRKWLHQYKLREESHPLLATQMSQNSVRRPLALRVHLSYTSALTRREHGPIQADKGPPRGQETERMASVWINKLCLQDGQQHCSMVHAPKNPPMFFLACNHRIH